MKQIKVHFTRPRSLGYSILIQPGLLGRAGALLKKARPQAGFFLISSPNVYALWGRRLEASLKAAGAGPVFTCLVPDGEENKNFTQFKAALEALASWSQGSRFKPVALLLGGGVVGDLGGFVAACFRRGIPFVQIPSTLLAMVDSSVGGKLAVDFDAPQGRIKNLVGAFYQPSLVLVDPLMLGTLPAREIRSGLAEAVKMAFTFDPKLFKLMEQNAGPLLAAEQGLMAKVIQSCAGLKARLVERDEFDDKGLRAVLNLGHTFGHALEAASEFRLRHGEGLSVGMACACDLAQALGLVRSKERRHELLRLEGLLMRLGLPVRLTGLKLPKVLSAMSQDKKFEGGMRFVLPLGLGRVRVATVKSEAAVLKALKFRLV